MNDPKLFQHRPFSLSDGSRGDERVAKRHDADHGIPGGQWLRTRLIVMIQEPFSDDLIRANP